MSNANISNNAVFYSPHSPTSMETSNNQYSKTSISKSMSSSSEPDTPIEIYSPKYSPFPSLPSSPPSGARARLHRTPLDVEFWTWDEDIVKKFCDIFVNQAWEGGWEGGREGSIDGVGERGSVFTAIILSSSHQLLLSFLQTLESEEGTCKKMRGGGEMEGEMEGGKEAECHNWGIRTQSVSEAITSLFDVKRKEHTGKRGKDVKDSRFITQHLPSVMPISLPSSTPTSIPTPTTKPKPLSSNSNSTLSFSSNLRSIISTCIRQSLCVMYIRYNEVMTHLPSLAVTHFMLPFFVTLLVSLACNDIKYPKVCYSINIYTHII